MVFTNCSRNDVANTQVVDSLMGEKGTKGERGVLEAQISAKNIRAGHLTTAKAGLLFLYDGE
jgi:hypothetical protein